jgi:hypothetical protein
MTVACDPLLMGIPWVAKRYSPVIKSRACQPLTTSAADPGPSWSMYWWSRSNWSESPWSGNSNSPSPSQFWARFKPLRSPDSLSMVPSGNSSRYRGAETVGSPRNDDSAESEQSRQLFERPSTVGPPSLIKLP